MSRRRADIERRISERENLFASILRQFSGVPHGTPMRSKDFAALGESADINRALAHLTELGRLVRVGRGIYMRPLESRFGKRQPMIDQMVASVARLNGETVVRHGAICAKNLGLAPHAPVAAMYLTSGRSRRMVIDDQAVELHHAPDWLIDLPVPRAGNVIRALAWLGPEKVERSIDTLARRLPAVAIDELGACRDRLPSWLDRAIGALISALRTR